MIALGFVLLLFVGALPVHSAEPTWESAEAERGGYRLITTDELWELYRAGSKDMILIDTRQGWEYRTGHIAGAVHFSMEPTWRARWMSRRPLRKLLGHDREKLLVFY
jgi:rhodanese-related sulfurtransferase